MADDKKSFLLYCDLIHTVTKIPNEQAGKLFKHVLSYVNDEDPETDDVIVDLVFEPIKRQLKRDLDKYEKRRQKNSESARLRWDANASSRIPKNANASSRNAKDADTDTDTEIDTVTDNDISIYKVNKKAATSGRRFIKPNISEVQKYCSERKNEIDAQQFIDHYEANGWKRGKTSIKDWKACVRTWETNKQINNNAEFKRNTSGGTRTTESKRQEYD